MGLGCLPVQTTLRLGLFWSTLFGVDINWLTPINTPYNQGESKDWWTAICIPLMSLAVLAFAAMSPLNTLCLYVWSLVSNQHTTDSWVMGCILNIIPSCIMLRYCSSPLIINCNKKNIAPEYKARIWYSQNSNQPIPQQSLVTRGWVITMGMGLPSLPFTSTGCCA